MSRDRRDARSQRRVRSAFAGGGEQMPPTRKAAVLACMDARLDVYRVLGLDVGEAHVIRNAGGVVTEDAIRSLVISQRLLGTEEIILIHHTDCGMLTFTDDASSSRSSTRPGCARLGARGVPRPRRRRPPVDRPDRGQPVHPAQERARLRLRRHDRQVAGDHPLILDMK